MPPITSPQDAYNRIRDHFARPGAVLAKYSVEEMRVHPGSPVCFYREGGIASSPVRCAAGVLIPDEMYDPKMDGNGTIRHLLVKWPEIKDAMGITAEVNDSDCDIYADPLFAFISAAQSQHDAVSIETVEEFLDELDALARRVGLTVPD